MAPNNIDFFFNGGVSVLIGTVDPEGNPYCCRGVALTSRDGGKTVTVYAPMATSQEVIANIAMTRRIAIGSSYPIDHRSIQLKGTTSGVRLATDDERSFIRSQVESLADTLDACGLPRRLGRSLNHWPAFAIDVQVEDLYEQTPGPRAGRRLE